ncbi:little elongation complex subunit 1 [Eleutherodactylus coqui]
MMPGETHSKTAGIASEAAGSCQNCTSLQQSLNEYVSALIALKQKIIDSDQLLAEYQQKCDDFQYAERENETLRCQLEQMLEKMAPEEQWEQEVKTLRAALEEKTSTLKIYQQSHVEFIKVKAECEQTDIAKKKLEAKLKKMEEAAAKHDKEYKQMKMEKRIIGKELKKIQRKLEGFQGEKSKKVLMKHAQTQATIEEPVVKLDRQKIKYLLKEIWGCIESSTEDRVCKRLIFDKRKRRNSLKCRLSSNHSSLEIIQTCSPLAELGAAQESLTLTHSYSPRPESAVIASPFDEDATVDILVSKDLSGCSSANSGCESEENELWEVQDWARPLPNLLSPIEGSPLNIKNVFGEFTDTSDAESSSEMDQSNPSPLRTERIPKNGTDTHSHVNEEVEHTLIAADNFAVNATVCNEGPDLETDVGDLEQTADLLPLQEAQSVIEDPIHMKYEDASDPLTNGSPEPASCERVSAETENLAKSLEAENKNPNTIRYTEKEKMLDNGVLYTTCKITTSYSPSINAMEPNHEVGKTECDTNRSRLTEDPLLPDDLSPDEDMLISDVTIVDRDQETALHIQSTNGTENEDSSCLCAKQTMSNNVCALSKDADCQKCNNKSMAVDLSKCSEETLDTMSTVNTCTQETEQSCSSTEQTYPESIPKPQTQPSAPSRQTSSSPSGSNPLSTVSECKEPDKDGKNIKENSICDKFEGSESEREAHHEVVPNTTGQQDDTAESLNKHDSITGLSTGSQGNATETRGGLQNCTSQKENTLGHETEQQMCHELGADTRARTSVVHGEDNLHACHPPENGDPRSSASDLDKSVASPVELKTEAEPQLSQLDSCNEDSAYSPKPMTCGDHLSPPCSAHLESKCTSCIDKSTDSPSNDPEKPKQQDINFPSVEYSSPFHVAVDSEHTNESNIIKAQCQDVTQSIESSTSITSSLSEESEIILCPLPTSGLIPVKANSSSKVLPVIPLEEFRRLHITSKSNEPLTKLEDTSDTCDVSLNSSESESEFPVRKVNVTRPALNVSVRSESFGVATKGEDALLILPEPEQQPKRTSALDEGRGSSTTANKSWSDSKVENDILVEPQHSVLPTVDAETKSEENAAECSYDGKSKDVSLLQKPERQSTSDNNAKDIRNNPETKSHRILPGKNLIWNFDRSVDLVDHRAACVMQKAKNNSKNARAFLGNSVSRSCGKSGKTQESDTSNKLRSSSSSDVRKENPQGGTVSLNAQLGQTVLANADTSTNTGHSPETINKVRSEMGPPLPPLLGPLLSTPPRSLHTLSPIMSSSSRSSLPSPLEEFISPLPGTPFPPLMSPLCDGRKRKSPVFSTPSPAERGNRRILSSPLQFCAATPKHAVPVPGRLPLSANGSSVCTVQENSVKILDTMYPELSARARTLNILKGNVQLNRGLSGDDQSVPVSQITGFKSITCTSTVFIKTGSNSKTSSKEKPNPCETQQSSESCTPAHKRAVDCFQMPKSAKKLRLDSESPITESVKDCLTTANHPDAQKVDEPCQNSSRCVSFPDLVADGSVGEDVIIIALKKVEELCFDLLPVIRSHVYVGKIPKVPVMRNEEKEVIYDFSSSRKDLSELFLNLLLKKIKTGKRSLDSVHLQALCRVYVGLCHQLGDIERARILCYSILKEDFPDPDKLLLFVISSWSDLLSLHGVLSKAIQALLKILAKDDVVFCLSAYLNWEKSPPMNLSVLLNSVLMAIQLYPDVHFHQSEAYGEDLTDNVWEYVFAVDLLCSHRKWIWTHENVISKELWPILDKWVKRKKGNLTLQFVPDIIVATVLRLIGHLCQMGLKEGFFTAVKNITSVIVTFISHANEEGVPWGVQLASVYMLCDTAPCDPALIHQTLQAWKETAENNLPPAVLSAMQEIASLCAQRNESR